jgi:tRNA (mo5U34)-methyltransferase
MPWPELAGKRCLDVGTMDGFWAFELERRGAGEVLASDVREPPRPQFALAAELLGSRAGFRSLDVYDLDPDEVGLFDVIVVGYVLQMLRDPLRALEALRSVCRGHLLLLETVSLPLELLPAPLARLDARRDGREWFVFNRRGLRKALRLTGWAVEETTPVLRDHPGPAIGPRTLPFRSRLLHRVGVRGSSAALRARPATL